MSKGFSQQFDNRRCAPHYAIAVRGKPASKPFESIMNKTALDLQQRVLALIARGIDTPTSDAEFDELARAVFAFQFEHNDVYRAYCMQQQCTPSTVTHWKEIPAVPTSAFKEFPIACFPP